MIKMYEATWWSTVDWENKRVAIIAENEEQVKEWIDKECFGAYTVEHRLRKGLDTLKIIELYDITLPYRVAGND